MLLFYTFSDCISGFLNIYGLPSLSVPYKIFLIFLMSINVKSYSAFLFFAYNFSLSFICFFHYFLYPYADFYNSVAMLLRIVMAPLLFFYLMGTYNAYAHKLLCVMKFNLFVIVINLLVGLLGFGSKTYSSEYAFGVKGFIIDGNSLAVAIFVMYVFFIHQYSRSRIIISFFFLFLGILVATKVSIFSIFLFGFYYFFKKAKKNKIIILFLLISLCCLFIYFILNSSLFSFQIWRIKNLMKLYSGNYLSVILSGRDIKLTQHIDFFVNNFSLKNFFLGYGFLNEIDIIELDIFDTFFSYGVLFFLTILLFYFYCFRLNRHNKTIVFFNVFYFAICVTSGHIWFNTISALFFSIVNLYFRGDEK